MLVKNQNLPKTERLCSKKLIEELFEKGSSVYLYPFRIQYLLRTDGQIAYPQVFFSIAKRNFKRANKRNLIRRRIREIYRLHKYDWVATTPSDVIPACMSIIYVSKEVLPSDLLTKKFKDVWKKLQATGHQTTSHPSL